MADYRFKANKGAANVQGIAIVCGAASSPRRGRVYDFSIGCGATPADLAFTHIAQRCTTAGTGTAQTPNANDQSDTIASTMVCKDTPTADPTLTAGAFLSWLAVNQRTTFRWLAPPGQELVTPAAANNGILFGLSAVTTVSFDMSIGFTEL